MYIDEVGKKYGKLTVMEYAGFKKGSGAMFKCLCDCGKTVVTCGSDLRSGHSKSCGCLQKEVAREMAFIRRGVSLNIDPPSRKTHGMTETRIYHEWESIKRRCINTKVNSYKNYGGRGISVCDEWMEFIPFYEWAISHGYSDELEIDRIDNDKGYSPDNCRWVTKLEQVRNRRNTVKVEHNGFVKPLAEWCEIYGVKYTTAYMRMTKGLAFEDIFKRTKKQEELFYLKAAMEALE